MIVKFQALMLKWTSYHPQLSLNFKSTVRKAAKYDIPFIQLLLWVTSSVRLRIITLEFIATGT